MAMRMPQRTGDPQRASVSFTGPLSGLGNSMLGMFGIRAGTPTPDGSAGADVDPRKSSREVQVNGIPLHIQLWLGARLPFAACVLLVAMFTYMYHIMPLLPWLIVFGCFDFAIIVCYPPKKIGTKRRNLWDWVPMCSWCIAIGFGILFGLMNYAIIEQWINTVFLRELKDVQSNANPQSVVDAGILKFASDVHLDTAKAAGYKHWFYNYCAAPVVGPDPTASPITFWAVGVGCCDSRGGFICDSAADKAAQSAMPVRPHNLGVEVTMHYNHAIKMAAAANDLEVAKDPVFVIWHKDAKAAGKFAWWLSTGLFIVFVVIALCTCCACQSGMMHIFVMQQ